MTYNKLISFLIFFFLLACSKDNNIDLSNAENVFQPKLNVSFVNYIHYYKFYSCIHNKNHAKVFHLFLNIIL